MSAASSVASSGSDLVMMKTFLVLACAVALNVQAKTCGSNERMVDHRCEVCPTGKFPPAPHASTCVTPSTFGPPQANTRCGFVNGSRFTILPPSCPMSNPGAEASAYCASERGCAGYMFHDNYDMSTCPQYCGSKYTEVHGLKTKGWTSYVKPRTCRDRFCRPPLSSKPHVADELNPTDAKCCEEKILPCDWSTARMAPGHRCSTVLWDISMSHEAAQTKCNEDSSAPEDRRCMGLMWHNKKGGDGRTAATGRYQGCAHKRSTAPIINADWDVIIKPRGCKACSYHIYTTQAKCQARCTWSENKCEAKVSQPLAFDGYCRDDSSTYNGIRKAHAADVGACKEACQTERGCTAYAWDGRTTPCALYQGGPYTKGEKTANVKCYQMPYQTAAYLLHAQVSASKKAVKGQLTITVRDSQKAVASLAFKGAVEKGIANRAGVRAAQVSAKFADDRRLSTTRRIAGSINVDYVIVASEEDSSPAMSAMKSATEAEMTSSIKSAIAESPEKADIESSVGAISVTSKTTPNVENASADLDFETADAPTTEAPTTEAPTTDAPVTKAPATKAPATEAPMTEAPMTHAPATKTPMTEAPTTEAPMTEAPATKAPATEAPATKAPGTEAPVIPGPVSTYLKQLTLVGDTEIDVESQASFRVGDEIVIDPGKQNEELGRVKQFGSIITEHPLQKAHGMGAVVQVVPPANPCALAVQTTAKPEDPCATTAKPEDPCAALAVQTTAKPEDPCAAATGLRLVNGNEDAQTHVRAVTLGNVAMLAAGFACVAGLAIGVQVMRRSSQSTNSFNALGLEPLQTPKTLSVHDDMEALVNEQEEAQQLSFPE